MRPAEPARKPALSSVRLNMPWESMTIADGGCGGCAIDSIGNKNFFFLRCGGCAFAFSFDFFIRTQHGLEGPHTRFPGYARPQGAGHGISGDLGFSTYPGAHAEPSGHRNAMANGAHSARARVRVSEDGHR